MDLEPKSTPGGRFALAIEMADLGIAMMRQTLRRRFPDADATELRARMAEWLAGPNPEDVDLKVVPWPR